MAAGLGFKTFTTGEVLTAADVNGYLMQGVLVFANAAARTSAITSPQEGQYSFLKDTNALEYYDGASWVGAPVGDITAVNAGTGISGGGSSGSVTITNDMATTITASGDIVVGTGNGTYDNLPIGSTGQVLTADTTVSPYKVKWAALSSGGLTLISRQTFSTVADTGTTFDGVFSSTYKTYQIVIENFFGSSSSSDMYLQLRYAGPTTQTSTYNWNDAIILSNGTTATAYQNPSNYWQLSRNTESSSFPLTAQYTIFKVGNASEKPQLFGTSISSNSEEATNFTGQQTTSRTYTGLIFSASTGTISGTVAIYGMAV